MQLFYSSQIGDSELRLVDDDHRHCSKVLRKKLRDSLIVTDGLGHKYEGAIKEISRNHTVVSIESKEHIEREYPRISIAIAPTKNMSRFEWFLEKATEIGIYSVQPILTKYSERKVLKTERCKKVLLSAMKQSQQFHLPILHEMITWKEWMQSEFQGDKFIAFVDRENHPLVSLYEGKNEVLLLIGPEGDFSREEIDMAFANGYRAVGLGRNRLRTETAGIVGVQILNGILDKKNNS